MGQPAARKYNDAPDAFAEFLDSGKDAVSLAELGGDGNPFIKAGIYARNAGEECCRVDRAALAEFLSGGLGCTVSRRFQRGWFFGKLRGYDVYFACSPVDGMYKALATTEKSVLIIGRNNPERLPDGLLKRVLFLSRLLYVKNGRLEFAMEAVEEKIPPEPGAAKAQKREPERRQSRPPVQVYAPYYLEMMADWMARLKAEGRTGRPSKGWIADWLKENGPPCARSRRLTERTVYRHIGLLASSEAPEADALDCRSPVFKAHWEGCENPRYVARFTVDDLTDAIMKAFETAKSLGFSVKTMRAMDAADFAERRAQA